jgi:hypothetical protein
MFAKCCSPDVGGRRGASRPGVSPRGEGDNRTLFVPHTPPTRDRRPLLLVGPAGRIKAPARPVRKVQGPGPNPHDHHPSLAGNPFPLVNHNPCQPADDHRFAVEWLRAQLGARGRSSYSRGVTKRTASPSRQTIRQWPSCLISCTQPGPESSTGTPPSATLRASGVDCSARPSKEGYHAMNADTYLVLLTPDQFG